MLTVFVVLALVVGTIFAGELVRGQCSRMLRRPHPSVMPVTLPSPAESVATADSGVAV